MDHSYCSQDFCCVICKQEVKGAESVKPHNCEMKSKKGAKFFGCENYPNCKWAAWKLPAKAEEKSLV